MSATTTELAPIYRASLRSSRNVFRFKLFVQGIFGCLFLIHSLYFVLSYATFDFFGARNSPFFAWLRSLSLIMQILYFPMLCAALISLDVGEERQKSKRLAAIFGLTQLAVGGALIFFESEARVWGFALLFGPTLQGLLGFVEPYSQAVIGLIPLAWISALHIRASFRSSLKSTRIANTMNLASFLLAGMTTSLLYLGAARVRLSSSDQPFTWSAQSISMVAHLASFALIFVTLQWIRRVANRFSNPGLVQFVLRAIMAWVLLAVFVRKIVFALLSFNDHLADLYAGWFSLAIVLFVASLSLRIKELRLGFDQAGEQVLGARRPRAMVALVAAIGLFYLFAIKLVAVDWEHVLSCLAALITSSLILWSYVALSRRPRNYGLASLGLLSLFAIAGVATPRAEALDQRWTSGLEQYSDYDPSFFAMQQILKPVVQDDKYAAWYMFLSQHANIRIPVETPDFPLTHTLQRTTTKKPHIFVFVIDALRRDYISAYNPAVTFTPALSAFAEESLVFRHAYSEYAGTELAVPAIFSGMQQLNKSFPQPVRRFNHLQDLLNVEGYDCYSSYNPVVAALAGPSDRITNLSTGLTTDDQQEFGAIVKKLESTILTRSDRNQPIFVYSQPANVHTLYLNWHRGQIDVKPHPGFDDAYASGLQRVDSSFGEFVAFLKNQGLYQDSIVIVTSDHGEDLGEMGRQGHVNNLTPEVIQIPLLIHLPDRMKAGLVWDLDDLTSIHDITPTLYYLLGHRTLRHDNLVGRSLLRIPSESPGSKPDHLLLMSSYLPAFGIISGDQKHLFYVDAILGRSFYYDLEQDPMAIRKRMTVPIREHYDGVIRQDLEAIDRFYGLREEQLSQRAP